MDFVDPEEMIDGTQMKAGNAIGEFYGSAFILTAFPWSAKFFNIDESSVRRYVPEFGRQARSFNPTKIYKAVESLLSACRLKAISHITGGGMRIFPHMMTDDLTASEKAAVPSLPMFKSWLKTGNIPEAGHVQYL